MVTFISFYHNRKNNSANESPSLFFPREFNLTVSVSMAKIASFHQYSFFFSFIMELSLRQPAVLQLAMECKTCD